MGKGEEDRGRNSKLQSDRLASRATDSAEKDSLEVQGRGFLGSDRHQERVLSRKRQLTCPFPEPMFASSPGGEGGGYPSSERPSSGKKRKLQSMYSSVFGI